MFVTTSVNYGDKPAGWIAIAAVRETAEKFCQGREEAALFLQNRTYGDDAIGGRGRQLKKSALLEQSARKDGLEGGPQPARRVHASWPMAQGSQGQQQKCCSRG
jgi:hypothetical protein